MPTHPLHSFALTLSYPSHYAVRCTQELGEALASAPAYAAWRAHDSGTEVGVFQRLAALPALTKADLRGGGPAAFIPQGRSLAQGLAMGEIELVTTSGTTSDQVTNVWYQPWWDASEVASWQLNAHAHAVATGAHREALLTSPWCTGFPCEDGFLPRAQRTLGRFLYLSERSDPSAWPDGLMDRMLGELEAFQPVVLEANPSFLARLARHSARKRRTPYRPALITFTYENPSRLHYRHIRRAFGDVPIASSYGSTEAGYVFMECEAGQLHQVTESCHVDFLPFAAEHGGPTVGRMLVTTLGNPWRSLVRFDIGDVARLSAAAPCPCGRDEGLTLASIEGRTVSLTLTPEGRAVTQGAVDRALADVPGLASYQLHQIGPAEYHLHIEVEDGVPREVLDAAREALLTVYGAAARVVVDRVEALAPDPPGKYRLTRLRAPLDADALLDARYAPISCS